VKRVSSRDNPVWKMLVRLCHSSRDRRKFGKCVLEGAHTILSYVDRFGIPELVIINEEAMDRVEMRAVIERAGERQVIVADARLFSELAQTATPTGVLGVIAVPRPGSALPGAFNLLLEDVQDPGNVGTMLRTAAAAGVTHAFLSEGCAFAWSPKVLRSGQGAHFFLEIIESADLPSIARGFAGKVVAAVPRADASLFDADLRGPVMFMVGNEGAGLSAPLIACATARVAIPMPGGFESLNAAAAAAVCLFEKLRQDRSTSSA
jgi:TrmH family RNA methyltransferase